jgi:hypothetical protein
MILNRICFFDVDPEVFLMVVYYIVTAAVVARWGNLGKAPGDQMMDSVDDDDDGFQGTAERCFCHALSGIGAVSTVLL